MNKIKKNEYQKALDFLKIGCECGCFYKVIPEKFAQLRADFQRLSKSEQDTFVMAQFLNTSGGGTSKSKRLKKRERINHWTFYRWDHDTFLCLKTYLNMLGMSHNYLESIRNHFLNRGLTTRIHGNTGKSPQWKTKMNLDQETKQTIKNFILNYTETHGLPDPGKSKSKKHSIIFLPTHMTYKSIYQNFLASLKENSKLKSLKYEAFRRLWHQLTPQIKFLNPRTDLCDTCHQFRNELHSCQDEKTKTQTKKNLSS